MRAVTLVACTMAAVALAGCASQAGPHGAMMGKPMAVATLSPTQGNTATGLVMFHEVDGHVMARAHITGLKPNGEHGFHLHEKGDCASTDGTSAGGHFNPGGAPHGPQDAAHHAGDMPALKADADGVADLKFMLHGVTIGGGPADITNRAVVVHANPDDYKTQPTGNSGARIACGVVARHP
ncbi:superoxide dismutase family protein [Ideonella sp. BN130291]|uniref:superoxide dismutase family protein n=1 Tax=Ideonella sp. BN130291 TaxID=3112940 RepID=UPI002E26E93E|nr:superoxide dismutase family protein [Ideonella sp. BN130291]